MKSSKMFFLLVLPLLIIAIIALSAFGRTLGSYFLEDDFGEVYYVSHIFAGNWHLLIDNLTGNYMQIPTMKVYRPFLLLSIMADYALWKTNAAGYFATNIIFLMGTAMMLYLVLRQLTRSWHITRSVLFSLLSAALFVGSPLHCESVSLMVGRVDIICSFFFLTALWAFIRKGNSTNIRLFILGLVSFWIALLTKEMAVGLPVILTAICFFFPQNWSNKPPGTYTRIDDGENVHVVDKLRLCLRMTVPVWISLFLYFILRFVTLGTFVGGYVGSIGAAQNKHLLEKWCDPDTLSRIVFPFNLAVFGEHTIYHLLFAGTYLVLAILFVLRLVNSGLPRPWLGLLAVWFATSLLPIYQLWGLGANLEGSRFLFFLTMPLAIFIPVLILAPAKLQPETAGNTAADAESRKHPAIAVAAVIALSILVLLQLKVAAKNNIPWVHAGKQTKAILLKGQELVKSVGQGKKIIVLGIPKEVDGAHIIYNGFTFNIIMMPPFAEEDLADHFITFDPTFDGDASLIDTQRFKREIRRSDLIDCYIWRQDILAFERLPVIKTTSSHNAAAPPFIVPLPSTKDILFPFNKQRGLWEVNGNGVGISQCEKGMGIAIGPINVKPSDYDFLEMEAIIEPLPKRQNIEAFWQGTKSNDARFSAPAHANFLSYSERDLRPFIYRLALSRHWRWFTEGTVKHIEIELPSAKSILIKNIRLLPDRLIVPELAVVDQQADNLGLYTFGKKGLILRANAEGIDNSGAVKLEVSKPNYFFDNFDGKSEDVVMTSLTIPNRSGIRVISSKLFPVSAYYQIRALALSKDGTGKGEWSYPITVKFN